MRGISTWLSPEKATPASNSTPAARKTRVPADVGGVGSAVHERRLADPGLPDQQQRAALDRRSIEERRDHAGLDGPSEQAVTWA